MNQIVGEFPSYSRSENRADAVVHVAGIGFALLGSLFMVWTFAGAPSLVAIIVYGFGLIATFTASAAYNMLRPGRAKELARRFDHAAIYVMIAGTYTPFSVLGLDGSYGMALLSGLWIAAAVGVFLKFRYPRRFERLGLVMYLAMGWAMLLTAGPVIAALSLQTLVLLVAGGLLYTLGSAVHHWRRLPFHNPIWHTMVLAAAILHYAAILFEFRP